MITLPLLLLFLFTFQGWSLSCPPDQLGYPYDTRCRRSSAEESWKRNVDKERIFKYPKFEREMRFLSGFGFSKTGKRSVAAEDDVSKYKEADSTKTPDVPKPNSDVTRRKTPPRYYGLHQG